MKTKKTVLFGLLFAVALSALSAETSLSVEGAVQAALENNLSLSRSRLDLEGKSRNSARSWNTFVPSLNAAAQVSHATSLTGDLAPMQDVWVPALSLSASWTFSPAMLSAMKKTGIDYEAGLISYEGAKQETELQVRKMFYQMLLLKETTALTDQSLATAQSRYEQTAALARAGQASNLDELSARVDLENYRPNLKNAEIQYANALDTFKQVLGIPPEETVLLEGSLEDLAGGPDGAGDSPLKQMSWTAAALEKNIAALQAQRQNAWNQAYIPSLRLSWNAAPMYLSGNWADNGGSFSASISLNLDSFFPWSPARSQINAVDDSIRDTSIRLSEALTEQELQVRRYTRLIEQSRENIVSLELNAELAEKTYEMYEESYMKGSAGFQQLQAAGDSLSLAKNKVQQERYNLLAAILDLEKALNVPFGTLGQ
jgi:outer membrane protein TolC